MRKRVIATLLAIAMLLGTMGTVVFGAEKTTEYAMAVTGLSTTEDYANPADGLEAQGLTLDLGLKGANFVTNMTHRITLALDMDVVRLVSQNGNTSPANGLISTGNPDGSVITHGAWVTPLNSDGYNFDSYVAFQNDTTQNIQYVTICLTPKTTYNSDFWESLGDAYVGAGMPVIRDTEVDLARIYLAFVEGKTVDDLSKGTIRLISQNELVTYQTGFAGAAVMVVSDAEVYTYNTVNISGGVSSIPSTDIDNLPEPQIIYPNSDVINLNGVKVTMNDAVNVPKSYPEEAAELDATVTATAAGYATSDCSGDELTPVDWTYSIAMKDGSDLPDTVSIDENGVVTVKAGAPEATVVVTATGTYTNDKGNDSTKSGTAELQLRHGDAGDVGEDPAPSPAPGDTPEGDLALSGVEIRKDNVKVTSSLTTDPNHEEAVAIPATGTTTVKFEGVPVDQFGDPFTATGTWESDANPTGVTFGDDGTITVAPGAQKGTYNYSYTARSFTAAVELTVDDNAIKWPTLQNDTIVYGETVSAFVINNDGEVKDANGPVTGATFAWTDGTVVLNANAEGVATQDVQMTCTYPDGSDTKTAVKNYAVKVKKADQKITIDQDALAEAPATEVTSVDVGLGDDVELNTVVTNATVAAVTGTENPTYALTDTNSIVTWDEETATLHGVKMTAADDSDAATLVINVAGNSNYNAATRTLTVRVTKPLLRATITFDTTDPKYNKPITATITEANDQTSSVTADVDFEWGHVTTDSEGNEVFTAATVTGDDNKGKLTAPAEGTRFTTLTYTPNANDIGKTLALKVITPTNVSGYGYVHSVKENMANPVAKASVDAPVLTFDTTTTSITVKTVDDTAVADVTGVKYAIEKQADEQTGQEPTTFGTNYAFTGLDVNTAYNVYAYYEETETNAESTHAKQVVTTDKIDVTPTEPTEDNPDPVNPITGENPDGIYKVELSGTPKIGGTLTATVTQPKDTDPETDKPDIFGTGAVYEWYRVDENGDETRIVGADGTTPVSGTTYTVTEDDEGYKIKVVVKPDPTGNYTGEISDITADKVGPAGYDITGVIFSYNASVDPEFTLIPKGETQVVIDEATGAVSYYNPADALTLADGSVTVTQVEGDKQGKHYQAFTISGVPEGTYKLTITKSWHLTYTIYLTVSGGNYDISTNADVARIMDAKANATEKAAEEYNANAIFLCPGELDGNGQVTDLDASVIYTVGTFGSTDADKVAIADIDGNGQVTDLDASIIYTVGIFGESMRAYVAGTE